MVNRRPADGRDGARQSLSSACQWQCGFIGVPRVIPVHSREATLLHETHKQLLIEQHTAMEKQKMADAMCSHTCWDLEARLDSLFTAFWRKLELRQRQVPLPEAKENLPHKLPS
ncbi:Hypothetical predicted protein [Pelobates cultripes]|uniref:Uncharacterized protein n=1 Tax=Pelobates cultripes TaxID=61616 RepID=A0AAD1RSR9_PELCU|nr:Hypothetical predicted protein [Pelobates cultripes]